LGLSAILFRIHKCQLLFSPKRCRVQSNGTVQTPIFEEDQAYL
jgi:hypothetical protein